MERVKYLGLALGLVALMPVMIWVAAGAAGISGLRRLRRARPAIVLTCTVDAECPPGYYCVNGVCVPEEAGK